MEEQESVAAYKRPKYDRKPKRAHAADRRLASRIDQNGGLNERQRRFVTEYIVCADATKAALAAGYSGSTAAKTGNGLLRNPLIAAEIEKFHKRAAVKAQVKADDVINELAKVAFDPEISQVKVRALELLGKHLQLFVEKVELKVDALTPEERAARAAALIATARNRLLSSGEPEGGEGEE